jgi:glycosyltransferase involved in cell wall biosynthesis
VTNESAAPSAAPDITVVMPVFNSMRFLPRVIPPLLAAGRSHGGVEFVFVDNGSSDGSQEYLESVRAADVRVVSRVRASIAALRNIGARDSRGRYLSFIDSDCLIDDSYFAAALQVITASGAAATGFAYDLPAQPGWIEAAWHELHYSHQARDVEYLNAGNFFVTRAAFDRVGGFRENLWTGEDAELGQRLNASGERIHADPSVRAIHLGNPKTMRQFFRRAVWHGVGMFGTVKLTQIDKPTAMMFGHLAATFAGLALVFFSSQPAAMRILGALALQFVIPALTVAFRLARGGRIGGAVPGLILYWLYYWARINALAVILSGGAGRYAK